MKKTVVAAFLVAFILALVSVSGASARQSNGAALYKKHCSGCHHSAANFKSGENILWIMRNPPQGMPLFDSVKIPDFNAQEIVFYIQQQVATKLMCKAS